MLQDLEYRIRGSLRSLPPPLFPRILHFLPGRGSKPKVGAFFFLLVSLFWLAFVRVRYGWINGCVHYSRYRVTLHSSKITGNKIIILKILSDNSCSLIMATSVV